MTTTDDIIQQFTDWFEKAKAHPNVADATAMALATATPDGKPSLRMVLLKEFDARGFTFYSNIESRKGHEIAANPNVALCFYWEPLGKQVRIEGTLAQVSNAEADAYFATRPHMSQIGAWASAQSQPLESREAFNQRLSQFEQQYEGKTVPRPPHWSGWRLNPARIEFWKQGDYRLHDREVFTRAGDGWTKEILNP